MFGFGYDCRNKEFKVVRLQSLSDEHDTLSQVEVYSLATHSWRRITSRVPPFEASRHVNCTPQMFVTGVLHWVVCLRIARHQYHNIILSFDVVEETFGEITLPERVKVSPFEVFILASGELLAVAHTNYSESDKFFLRIWVMKEYGVAESWIEVFHSDSRRYGGIAGLLAIKSSGEVVLSIYGGSTIILDGMKVVKD